ncbi:MAG: heme-binding protein [Proteobacteria bacterium]|nr:heme-binding protein [Pseudomonadota bacterium]
MRVLTICTAVLCTLSATEFSHKAFANDAKIERTEVLTFAQAKSIQARAEAIIASHKIGGVVTIVDASGQTISLHRLDGATVANSRLAPMKAHTAVAFGQPTDAWGDKLAQGNMSILGNPEILPLPGGLPIKINGTLVGAIGVSTPVGAVDLEAAKGAVDGFKPGS